MSNFDMYADKHDDLIEKRTQELLRRDAKADRLRELELAVLDAAEETELLANGCPCRVCRAVRAYKAAKGE